MATTVDHEGTKAVPPFGIFMSSCTDPAPLMSGEAVVASHTGGSSTSMPMIPVESIGIDSFHETLANPTDLPMGPIFGSQRRTTFTQVPLAGAAPVLPESRSKSNAYSRGPICGEELGGDADSLGNVELHFALLEQALTKDGTVPPTNHVAPMQVEDEKNCSPSVLEAEMFYCEVFGDDALPAQHFTSNTKSEENLRQEDFLDGVPVAEDENQGSKGMIKAGTGSEKGNCRTPFTDRSPDSVNTDTNLSSALASLVGSNSSNDFGEPVLPRMPFEEQSEGKYNLGEHTDHARSEHRRMLAKKSLCTRRKLAALRQLQNSNIQRGDKIQKRKQHKLLAPRNNKECSVGRKNTDVSLEAVLAAGFFPSIGERDSCESIPSPISDSSMSNPEVRSHPDLYENLDPDIREKVDRLREKISPMPRRKLRESLAAGVTIEDVEPLMCVNRDELATMLGLGVTTWKMFVHHTLSVPRWPARALKSQQVREQKLMQRLVDAEGRGEFDLAQRLQRELARVKQNHLRKRTLFRNDAKIRISGNSNVKKSRKSALSRKI